MAKNESTAVNELIQRMATMTPLKPDPADDLMFRQPAVAPPSKRTGSTPAHGSEVSPLPRNRSAHGTPVGAMTMQGLGTPALPIPPAGKPTAAMTMQGLGPLVQRAPAEEQPGGRPPLPPPARRSARTDAQPRTSLPLPAAAPPLPPRMAQAQPAQPEPPPTPPPSRRTTSTPAPRSMPVAAPFESGSMPVVPSNGRSRPAAMPAGHAAAPVMLEAPTRAWFEQAHERLDHDHVQHEEAWVGTLQVHRRSRRKSLAGKLIAPMIILAILGALAGGYFAYVGGYVAFDWLGGKPRTPEAVEAAPAPAPKAVAAAEPAKEAPAALAAPAVKAAAPAAPAPIATTPPTPPAFVDVMLLSTPAGATVTLVDRGKTSFIGTTPVATALDPSRKYELVFSHPSKPTWIEPLDPSTTRRVEVKLGRAAKTEKVPALAAPAPAPAPAQAAPRPRIEAKAARAVAAPEAPAAAAPAGEGTLMISTKPPCEIIIDGKPTGLTTPQRDIQLPAGSHKITLVNKAENIDKTISVQITPDKPTKVIQDLMK